MLVVVTYDVDTRTHAGERRLRRVAKICRDYGQRVQCSVFECDVDSATLLLLMNKLLEEINPSEDSLRFYNLGNHYNNKVQHMGLSAAMIRKGFWHFRFLTIT